MQRQTERGAAHSRLTVAGLFAIIVLSAACQTGGANNGNTTSPPDGQVANARTSGAATPNNQTNANTVNAGHQPSDNAGGTDAAGPAIQITDVPPRGAGGPDAVGRIAGTAGGAKLTECKVVLFTRTDKWYVQPYIDSPDTTIEADGKWENDTHLGSEYAALLVKNSFKPPSVTGTLPNVGGAVLAIAKAPGTK